MSDTTTQDVRDVYSTVHYLVASNLQPEYVHEIEQERAESFDRWLNEQLAEAWGRGEATGWSRAMRHMSDEPSLGRQTENPYRPEES